METPIIDSPNETPQTDREFLLNQLKQIEFRIEDLNRGQDKTLTAEAIRGQILISFFNIHNNLPEHKKDELGTIKKLLKEIESRVQSLSKMLQQLRIKEELERLKREQDKVKSDLANLNQQSRFGFHKK